MKTNEQTLTDAEIDDAQEAAYTALVATGFDGGMGGFQWDRASARAIEQAVIAKLGAVAGDEWLDQFHYLAVGLVDDAKRGKDALQKAFDALMEHGKARILPAASEAEPVGYVSQQAFDQMSERGREIDLFPSSQALTDEFPVALPMPIYAAPTIRNPLMVGSEAGAVPVSIGMVRWRNGEPFVALNKNGRELEAGSILYAAPVEAGAVPVGFLIPEDYGDPAFVSIRRLGGDTDWPRSWKPVYVTPPAPVEAGADAAVAAIQFALEADEGMAWLQCWNEGDFDACRKEWPETPEECFIGADPLHPKTKNAAPSDAPAQQEATLMRRLHEAADLIDRHAEEIVKLRANQPAPAAQGDERVAFEHAERASNLERDGEGEYVNPCVQSAWEGWQARAALSRQPSAPASAGDIDVPPGYILVPAKPTIAACITGAASVDNAINGHGAAQVYAAMTHAMRHNRAALAAAKLEGGDRE